MMRLKLILERQAMTKKNTSMKDKAKVKQIQKLMINSKTKATTLKVAR